MADAAFDSLKIYCIIIIGTDDPYEVTPFQGLSISWRSVSWAFDIIASLPADVLERTHPVDDVIGLRMGGACSIPWVPLNIKALESVQAIDLGAFVVLFSGEKDCAERIAAWMKKQKHSVLHVSSEQAEGAHAINKFTTETLRSHCIDALKKSPDLFSKEQREAAEAALPKWAEPPEKPSGLKAHGHNITRPNYMALRRAFRTIEAGKPFIGNSEKEYTDVILESAEAVARVREEIGVRPYHAFALLRPLTILAEPALYRPHYKRVKPTGMFEEKIVAKALRWIQTQKGLCTEGPAEFFEELKKSPTAQGLIATRQSELDTFTRGVGLHAAQTTSAVIRLSPGVNHVFSSLSAYARSVRANNMDSTLKARRLFNTIQEELHSAVGDGRVAFIQKHGGPVRIIADAPVEWLPIGNLPLALRYDCSRINATPGNLLMAQLIEPATIVFKPEALRKLLIVSSFTEKDGLRDVLKTSLEALKNTWEHEAEIIFKTAQTTQEFIDVLNAFDGYIMVFDGHGADNADEPVGKLMIGNEAVDVWDLRNKVRIPAIVILSACDTHGIDASSQATVGNGLLVLGARTVLATLLPVGGISSASFITRLIHRLADFVPSAIKVRSRVLNWTEIVSGMLRMLLVSEMLDSLVAPPSGTDSPRGKIQLKANTDINVEEDDAWFDNLLGQHRRASRTGGCEDRAEGSARHRAMRSDPLRPAWKSRHDPDR